jgi:hypothetical protein
LVTVWRNELEERARGKGSYRDLFTVREQSGVRELDALPITGVEALRAAVEADLRVF